MKSFNIYLLLFILISVRQVFATDYYVSQSGAGDQDGRLPEHAAPYSNLYGYLRDYRVNSSDLSTLQLNVYIEGNDYTTPGGGFIFNNTAANTRKLQVHFYPYGTDSVIFYGAPSDNRFITLTAGANADDALKVTIENIHFRNFHSTNTSETGGSSLFSLKRYNKLDLMNVSIDGISSRRNSLLSLAADASFNVENSKISNITQKIDNWAIIETVPGGNQTILFKDSELFNWRTEVSGIYTYIFWLEDVNCSLVIENTIIRGCNAGSAIIGSYLASSVITLKNSIIKDCASRSGGVIFSATNFSRFNITDCSFTGNQGNNTPASALFYFPSSGANVLLSGSTFSGNTRINYTINCAGLNMTAYNNTFSGNSGTAIFYTSAAKSIILNNTFCKSGDINNSNTTGLTIWNNLLLDGEIFSNLNVNRNIIKGKFYEAGISSGVTIPNIENYVNTTLTEYEPGRPMVHPLITTSDPNPILEKGGDMSLTEYAGLLTFDQRGKIRPKLVSIGSCDLQGFAVKDTRYTILYDPEVGLDPSYPIDLHDAILYYPDYVDLQQVDLEIIDQPYNGQLNQTADNMILEFIPKTNPIRPSEPAIGMVGVPFEVKFKITYDENGVVRRTIEGSIFITIVNIRTPMGIVDDQVVRCYGSMQPVEFETRYKFITSFAVGGGQIPGYSGPFPNEPKDRFYGFSIPLVGDLDGDRKPEVICIGIGENETGVTDAYATYLYILNGQTGKTIVKYRLPMRWNLGGNYWHNAPSSLALVDSDRNGKAEIIVAMGYNASNLNLSKRLISYEINEYTFTDREGGSDATSSDKLSEKWTTNTNYTSDLRYDAFGTNNQSTTGGAFFSKPLPQVVDLDADGNAEIIVYNKIYDAKTGRYLMKLGDLAATINTSSAYVGQDRQCNYGDEDIGFAFIYDVDQDGVYDVAAGGKLYYKISLANKTYQELQMPGIGDGHTAVADINADGIPEIIVSAFNNTGKNSYGIKVWDPGLLTKDATGKIIPAVNGTPQLLAERSVSNSPAGRDGAHSYIYIADIDGKLQNGKKFPEISVLSSYFFTLGDANARNVPVHPNVAGGPLRTDFAYTTGSRGSIYSFTWDDNATLPTDRLKVSFIMEHQDNSVNTGFTLFDFDNDGVQDICYRDERKLRIISASKPYVALNETDPNVIRFEREVKSYTGFEYPVIADIDGSASAKIIVMGHNAVSLVDVRGYVYAVEHPTGKFAPAPKVWNQFMYSPLKINEDLTTPMRTFNPLDTAFRFRKNVDDDGWVYPYNSTITQAVKSATFEVVNASGDTVMILAPIVYTADAQVLHTKIDQNAKKLRFYVKNNGDASLNAAIPICLYRENNIPGGFINSFNLGTDVFVGDSVLIEYDLTNQELDYQYMTIRISDATTVSDIQDQFMTVYQDCNWADNVTEVGDFVLRNVNATVAQYKSVIIDVLANDSIPQGCDARLRSVNITSPGGEGVLEGDFGVIEIIGNKLEYTAPATYADGVVEITYKIECGEQSRTAKIYIYILESCYGNFSVCENTSYQVCLKSHFEGIKFDWYNKDQEFMSNIPPYYDLLAENKILYVKPRMPEGNPYRMIDFPLGQIIIDVLPAGQGMHTAFWTGVVDTDWNNPRNWIKVENGVEYPVSWIPTNCVHVVLPEETAYYPMLDSTAACADIRLENRAMIAGLHHLTYSRAEVALSLSLNDLDRFLMWSAPLKSMYTGDYHFDADRSDADRGDVYMNFFQSKNPDYPSSVPTENVFTSTFGSLDMKLSLGQAFGLKVYRRDGLKPNLLFPRTATTYKYENGSLTGELDRTYSGRFIVDGAYDALGGIDMEVNGDNDFRMIHVTNPFMAYLKVDDFLEANETILEQSCKLWNGDINESFVSIIPYETEDQRIIIDFDQTGSPLYGTLISPLQSFFVMKKPGVNSVTSLYISDAMTTTINRYKQGGYELLNAEKETHILRIKATQDKYTDMTVVYNNEEARPEYNSDEDSRKLFNENSRIAVYTLSPSKIPLAINSNGDFSTTIPLGIKVKDEGMVTLSFSGLTDFGYDVVFRDLQQDKSINVEKESTYSFMVEKPVNGITELNDRFILRFTENVGNEELAGNRVRVIPRKGFIDIHSLEEEMKGYQVYNLLGQRMVIGNKPGHMYQVEVPVSNFYVVKVMLKDKYVTEKVFVE